jgi:F-type H+-transporting ATPase subunit gamma
MKLAAKRAEELRGTAEVKIFALGKKGRDFFKKRDYEIAFEHLDLIRSGSYENISPIAEQVRELFLDKEYDRVEVFYTAFKSAMVQTATHSTLLPFRPEECAEEPKSFLFKPQQSELLDSLVPMLVDFQLYHYVLESVASEHGARMAAMESATNNARDMIDRLTLQRNRARQAAITTELMEIISGAEALAG